MPPCSTLGALSHLQHLLAAPNAGSRPGKEQLVAVALASSSHQSWRLSWQEREARGYPPAAITPGSLLTLPRGSQAILWQLPTGHCCSPSDTQAAVTASLSFVCTGNSPRFRLPSPDAELSSPPQPPNTTRCHPSAPAVSYQRSSSFLFSPSADSQDPASHPAQIHCIKGPCWSLFTAHCCFGKGTLMVSLDMRSEVGCQ